MIENSEITISWRPFGLLGGKYSINKNDFVWVLASWVTSILFCMLLIGWYLFIIPNFHGIFLGLSTMFSFLGFAFTFIFIFAKALEKSIKVMPS